MPLTQENISDSILQQAHQGQNSCLDSSQITKGPTILESAQNFGNSHVIGNKAMPLELNLINITPFGFESLILNEHLDTKGEESKLNSIDSKKHYIFHPVDNIPIELDTYGPLLDTILEVDLTA